MTPVAPLNGSPATQYTRVVVTFVATAAPRAAWERREWEGAALPEQPTDAPLTIESCLLEFACPVLMDRRRESCWSCQRSTFCVISYGIAAVFGALFVAFNRDRRFRDDDDNLIIAKDTRDVCIADVVVLGTVLDDAVTLTLRSWGGHRGPSIRAGHCFALLRPAGGPDVCYNDGVLGSPDCNGEGGASDGADFAQVVVAGFSVSRALMPALAQPPGGAASEPRVSELGGMTDADDDCVLVAEPLTADRHAQSVTAAFCHALTAGRILHVQLAAVSLGVGQGRRCCCSATPRFARPPPVDRRGARAWRPRPCH